MATDHDFKIKNGARVSGEKLILGSSAYSADSNYVGLKTSVMTGSTEYMIISAPTDKNTYISAGANSAVYIRGGGNNTSHQLIINSAGASFAGNLTVSGNFTVSGTTTTLNTATLNVEDKNITLNYGSGDTSGSANGSGITIQDAMAVNHDATILWDTSNDRFNFSDPINVGITGTNQQPGTDSLNVAGYGIIGNRGAVYLTNANSNGTVQIGVGGAHNANPKLTVSSSAATFTVPITSTYFLSSLADSTPAGTTFANAFNGDTRVAYFDGATTTSVWWGSGNTPYAAIDAQNGILRLYVNNTGGSWSERIQMNSSGITNYGTTTVVATNVHLDSSGSAYYRADGGTNQWKYLSLQTNGSTNWDIATKNNDLSGALQFRPAGGPTNRTYMDTSGNWVFNGRLTNTDTVETQKIVLDFDTGGDMILGHDGSYGTSGNGRYITLGFGGTTNGTNRIFAHNGTADGIYFAAATGQGFRWRPNGSGSNSMELTSSGQLIVNSGNVRVRADSSYGSSYGTVGFGGTSTGFNRISGRTDASDGLFLQSATGRHIYFRTGGSSSNTFIMTSSGNFQVGSTTVIDSSRNLTNIGTITNSGKISSSIGSNATYSGPLLEITSSATPTQIKITTNIPYSGSGASTHAHSVRISGFQYGSAQMADLQIGWHVYNNVFYNRSVTSSGSWAPTVTLAVENNKVVIHLASPGYWPKLYVESMYNAYGGAGQASGWSWADAAISADANTPNQTVPYKFDYGNGVLNSAGTTVIDSSRNLTNIGSITAAGNLSLDGGRATFDTDTGSQPFQLNRIGIATTHNQSLRMWVDDSYAVYESNQDETNRYGGHMFRSKHGTTAYTRFQITAGSTSEVNMYNNTGTATWQWDGNNSRQGINKVAPDYTLDVNGTANATNLRIGTTEVITSGRNLTSIGTISSGAITSTGTSTFNNFRLTDSSKMGFGTVKGSTTVGHSASTDEGIFWHTDNGYGIYRTSGAWSSPNYQQLKLKWLTGIQLDGGTAYGKSGVDLVNNTVLKINGTAVTNSSGQWTGGLNPSSLDVTHSSADSVLRIAHGAANSYDAVIQLSGSAANMATEGAEIWYDNQVGDVHISTTYASDDAAIRFHTRTGASKSTSNERLTIFGNGSIGINKTTGLDSSYKLHMGGHLRMHGNHIHYANELHFNNGTRFKTHSTSTTLHRSATNANSTGIAFQSGSSNSTRGYIWGNADSGHSIGLLDAGGNWAVRHINDQGTIFYSDNGTEQAAIGRDLVAGNYGSMVVKDFQSGWAGYSINNAWVFMADGATNAGIYNDTDNEWAIKTVRNSEVVLYHNGSTKLQTTSTGIDVTGNITHDGLTPTSGTDIDQIYTAAQTLTITTSYQDTGVNASELAGGTYIVQLTCNDHSVGGAYSMMYSGVMSWYSGNTNDNASDEIVLHRTGHASVQDTLYLRTISTLSADTNDLKLQIKGNYNATGSSTYTFKFRRMI